MINRLRDTMIKVPVTLTFDFEGQGNNLYPMVNFVGTRQNQGYSYDDDITIIINLEGTGFSFY